MVVIAGISGSVILWNHNKSGVPIMGSQAVKEASAEKGSISKTIVGTGNLEADTPVNVTVPSGVVIDEVKVESGDHVSAGDVLATVDNASVLSAMRDVQEKIENLDGVINETKDETEAGELTASVDGRVKRIYVSQGSSIADSMLENGAVMLLSIDGKMAVKLELTGAAAEGDNVTVLLLDGSEKTGTIECIDGSTCVITFSDSDVGIGENVSVTDAEGTILGSGEAYIHQQLAVTATGGTVEEIKVSEDESVSADTTLLTLTETTQSVKYLEALAEREAYAETLQKLIELSGSGSVKAEMDGTIQSVNVSAGSSESSQNSSVSQTSVSGSSSGRVSNMSYQASDMRGYSYEVITLADTGGKMEESSFLTESSTEAETRLAAAEQETKIQLEVAGEGESTSALLALAAPRAGEKPQSDIAAADGSYTGTVTYQPGDDPFAADTVYQAQVQLTANEGWYFQVDSIFRIESGAVSGITVSSDNKILSFTITYPATEKNSGNDSGTGTTDQNGDDSGTGSSGTGTDGTGSSSTGNSGAGTGSTGSSGTGSSGTGSSGTGTGSTGSSGTGSSGTGSSGTGISSTGNNGGIGNSGGIGNDGSTSGTDNSTGNGTGTLGLGETGTGSSGAGTSGSGTSAAALSSSSSSSGSSDSTDTAQASQYSTDVAAFTISSDDNMVLSVNVDELDINSVSKGQTAALTFDAIEDKEFEGEVTKVGSSASASGGVAKYSVNITVARDSRMKTGMNASATITVESREDVITIPVDAIQEKGNRTFVYTGRDAEGNLSDETEVTTGLSDGSTVEITEGLAEGDTVYYQRISSDSSSGGQSGGMSGDFGGMGGGMMEDRGSGSGGKGNMPDFGGQGQMQSPPSMN
ncbi:MAG: HlyD family efflux transporter periplasmic adaptor subunit [Blautia producta]|uniref:HlyD family efflux transporter periplasmic adaptor subunit n=1 Tax=Blautia producta TaxID=33035 RepID=UPI00290CD245|nr:HlyD family efflux transporter periplasmic adaptor subunit [Blautia producta]MDU5383254.1 HlyD family efflux transporter periplasmic adaptor subunit [Blautia producta]MDU6881835.1 HlyD family efflux transporter periplasmic adaptor subunit [Blautia producta]